MQRIIDCPPARAVLRCTPTVVPAQGSSMRHFLLVVLALVAILGAAAPKEKPAKPPASKPAPIVLVTRLDGTTERGQIDSIDPDHVVIKPALKRGQTTPDAPVTIEWKVIKVVSSGLTQAKALEQWKQEHKDNLCDA